MGRGKQIYAEGRVGRRTELQAELAVDRRRCSTPRDRTNWRLIIGPRGGRGTEHRFMPSDDGWATPPCQTSPQSAFQPRLPCGNGRDGGQALFT